MTTNYSNDPLLGQITQTSEGVFKADKTIIKSVAGARSIYERLREAHLKRIMLYAEIDGLIQGNPPYNVKELHRAGLHHIANFNDMSARGSIKRACLAYWNLLHNSQNLVKFVLRVKDPHAGEWAQVMARHWDAVVRAKWPSFLINIASLSTQLVKFGIAPILFPDERDPRWRVVELNKFLIPDQTQSDVDMITTVMLETDFTIQYLWSVYEEYKDKPKSEVPWNVDELGKLLVQAVNTVSRDNQQPMDYMEMQRKLYSGDISFDRLYNDTIRLVSLFQKEYNGKVSHYMFHRYYGLPAHMVDNTEDFVFFQQDQYDSISDAFVIFTKDPGEFTIHANRGLGHEIYSLAQAKIQLDCSVVDMAKWASTPILKGASTNSKDVDQIRFYPGVPTNIGTAEFVQNNMGANVNNVIGAAQYLSNLIQFNTTYSGTDPANPDPDKGSLSPAQVKLLAYKEFNVLKNNIMHFYASFDRVVQNMTAKMLKTKESYPGSELGILWKERCLEDGVPEEVFKRDIEAYATRVAGAGSQVAQLIGLQEMQQLAGSFGPREEKAYKRQFIIAALGPEALDEFDQDSDTVDEQAGGASLAGVENAVMQAGKSPIFSMDNDHRSHAAVHMSLGVETIKMIQAQQLDAIGADKVFSILVPHLSEHLAALERSPFTQAEFAKMKKPFDQIAQYATLNRQNAAKMLQAQAKAQAEQQQVMSEEQLKNYTTMEEEKRKNVKLSEQLKRQEEQQGAKQKMLEEKTRGELSIQREKAKGEVEVAKMKEGQVENPVEELQAMSQNTPAPYDIEGIVK